MYEAGEGVPQDYAEAVRWYRKAADAGIAAAEYNLGRSYFTGHGVPQDYAEAFRWSRKAADSGHAAAQTNLGVADGVSASASARTMLKRLSLVSESR